MKHTIIGLFFVISFISGFSQIPAAFNYQAVLRDASGTIKVNKAVTVRVDLLQTSTSGTSVYAESFSVTTNAYGLINLQIGLGTIISGTFSSINWGSGPYFIKVTVDGTEMGTSQLLSVPYALYAGNAANAFTGNYDDLTNKPTVLDYKGNAATGIDCLISNTGQYNTGNGNYSLYSNTSGLANTAFGFFSLRSNTTGNFNTAIGGNTLYSNTTGNYNTAIGEHALWANTIGNSNTANGYNALHSSTSGHRNTANGSYAIYSNISGSNNLASGNNALYHNTTGYSNVALGYSTLFNNLTTGNLVAVGDSALYNNTANGNTAIGSKALYANTTGNQNTAMGYQAMYTNNDGFENVAIGGKSLLVCNGNANTAIGFNALSTIAKGRLNTAIGCYTSMANDIYNATAIGNGAYVNASHKIVIGNAEATTVGGYGLWTNYSDRRLKENIVYTNKLGLNFITLLKPVKYNYIKDTNKRRRDGLIAQDVEQVLKELGIEFSGLVTDDDKEKTMNLSYESFVIPIITAIQELNQQNLQLKQENQLIKLELSQNEKLLEATISELKAKMENLENSIKNK